MRLIGFKSGAQRWKKLRQPLEVAATIEGGESFPAKFGRTGFRRNFPFDQEWRGKHYATKQIEAFAVQDGADWLAISFVTRYF